MNPPDDDAAAVTDLDKAAPADWTPDVTDQVDPDARDLDDEADA